MSRIVVTGGAGRLGRSVVSQLCSTGNEVLSIDLVEDTTSPASIQLQLDLSDPEASQKAFASFKPQAVIHLAAIAVPFSRPEADIFVTNTTIMYNVLDATVDSGADSLLVASSPTVVGYGLPDDAWTPAYLPLDENHPVEPWHGYAASKQALENITKMASRQYGKSIRFGSFRPCYVISPEEWAGAETQQGHTVQDRLDHPELSAVALFNYVDSRDAAEFVEAWLEHKDTVPNGQCFFVGATDALATSPLSELLPRHIPGTKGFAAGLKQDQPAFDCSLALELLGWQAKRSWRTELDPTRAKPQTKEAPDQGNPECSR